MAQVLNLSLIFSFFFLSMLQNLTGAIVIINDILETGGGK